jgi:putative transposase
MKCVRRAVVVEIENPPPELYAVEKPYRRIVEEVVACVAGGRGLERRSTTNSTENLESCTPHQPS